MRLAPILAGACVALALAGCGASAPSSSGPTAVPLPTTSPLGNGQASVPGINAQGCAASPPPGRTAEWYTIWQGACDDQLDGGLPVASGDVPGWCATYVASSATGTDPADTPAALNQACVAGVRAGEAAG